METSRSEISLQYPMSPTRPDFISFTVPYICADAPYDHIPGGFRDFPRRRGWFLHGEPENPGASAKFHRLTPSNDTPIEDLISESLRFYQAWLLFGFLAEVSSITGLKIDIEAEFLSNAGDTAQNKVVAMGQINGLAERWLNSASQRRCQWKAQLSHIYTLCRYVKCRMVELRGENWTLRSTLGWDIETKVLLSIEIAYRAVLLALARSGEYSTAQLQPLMKTGCFNYRLRLWRQASQELRRQSWCSSERRTLAVLDRELPYSFFLTTLKRIKMDHYKCGEFVCMADQINEDAYQTVHVEPGCQCGYAAADVEQLCAIIEHGKVPLVSISPSLNLQVVTDRPYVAISHVCAFHSPEHLTLKFWELTYDQGSHGIGNPTTNAIPLCQLQRLQSHLLTLQEKFQLGINLDSESPCTFWMDTLCIPVQPILKEYRKKAIRLMGQTYSGATAVLVLDRELREVDSRNTTILEQCLWVVFSGWMRRLWTLQEAALAKILFIVMKDGPVRYEQLDDSAILVANKLKRGFARPGEVDDPISEILFYKELQLLIQRRIPQARHFQDTISEVSTQHTRYQYFCAAVEGRCTSKLDDEPIILAIMMGQKDSAIFDEPDNEKKMAIWHQTMRRIPADIIFIDNQVEKLSFAPFRWAPRSLVANEIARQTTDGVGICDADGLHVEYAAFMLCDRQEPYTSKVGEKWYLRDKDTGTVHKIRHNMDGAIPGPPERCAVLTYLSKLGFGVVVRILGEMEWGDVGQEKAMSYVVSVVGLVQFFAKEGLKPGKIMKIGREVLVCTSTEAHQRWCIT